MTLADWLLGIIAIAQVVKLAMWYVDRYHPRKDFDALSETREVLLSKEASIHLETDKGDRSE